MSKSEGLGAEGWGVDVGRELTLRAGRERKQSQGQHGIRFKAAMSCALERESSQRTTQERTRSRTAAQTGAVRRADDTGQQRLTDVAGGKPREGKG